MNTKRKYQRLAPSTWALICAEWEIGDVTLEELSARFGVNTRTLQSHFSKHNVVKAAKAASIATAVKDELFKAELDVAEDLLRRAKDTRESAYKNAVIVETLIMAQLDLAQRDPAQVYKAAGAVKLLSLAAAGLERLHSLKWDALGMNRDTAISDELPILVFEDMTSEDIADIQRRGDGNSDDDKDDQDPVLDAAEQPEPPNWDDETDDDDEIVEIGGSSTTDDGCRLVREARIELELSPGSRSAL